MDLNQLNANISLNIQNFVRGMGQVASSVQVTAKRMEGAFGGGVQRDIDHTDKSVRNLNNGFKDMDRIVGGILISQMFYQGTQAIVSATAAMTGFISNMEKAQISMEYFLGGDSEAAKGFIMNMKDFSAETAFNTDQAINLSKKLLNAGFQATQVRSIMERLNDATAVAGMSPEVMDRIVLAMTQMKTNGKIMGTELRQLAEANIPVYKILQEQLGLTGEQILNIGEMKIDSDIGLAAIFEGLKKYEGAADRLADTLPGMWETIKDSALIIGEELFAKPYAALKGFIERWRNGMDGLREALVESGIGGVFEKLIPPELHTSVRLIIGSFGSLIKSAGMIYQAFLPVIQLIASTLTMALGVAMPYVAYFVRALAEGIRAAMNAVPAIKYLAVAIGTIMVANTAARALMLLWSVMRLGFIASAVGQAVLWLARSIQFLTLAMTRNPIIAVVMVLAGALLYLATSSATATRWLDALMQRLGALGGFDVGKVMQPEDNKSFEEWTGRFNESLDNMGKSVSDFKDGVGGIGDKTKDAGKGAKKAEKDIKKFVAAFDELYQVPDNLDDVNDGLGGVGKGLDPGAGGDGMPDMSMPDMNFEPPKMPDMPKMPGMDEIKLPEIVLPGKGKPGGAWGDWFNFPTPDLVPVTQFLVTIEGLIANLKLKLQNALGTAGGWIAETAGAFGNWVAETGGALSGWATGVGEAITGWTVETGNAIKNWTVDTGQALSGWTVDTGKALYNWAVKTGMEINAWAATTAGALAVWAKETGVSLTVWAAGAMVTISAWAAKAGESIKQWASDTGKRFKDWATVSNNDIVMWAMVAGAAILAWVTLNSGRLTGWANTTTAAISTWSQGLIARFIAWSFQTSATIDAWTANTKAKFTAWAANTKANFSTWAANTQANFQAWAVNTSLNLATWAATTKTTLTTWSTVTKAIVATWVTKTAANIAAWGVNTGTNIALWAKASMSNIGSWATATGASIASWINGTAGGFSAWTNNVLQNLGAFANGGGRAISSWASSAWNNISNWLSGTSRGIGEWANSSLSTLAQWAQKAIAIVAAVGRATGAIMESGLSVAGGHISSATASIGGWASDNKGWLVPAAIAGLVVAAGVGIAASGGSAAPVLAPAMLGLLALETGGIVDQDQLVRIGEGNKREAVIPLENSSYMKPFSAAVANDLAGMLGGMGGQQQQDSRPIVYVHNLIADKRGLKELERELQIIRQSEGLRGAHS